MLRLSPVFPGMARSALVSAFRGVRRGLWGYILVGLFVGGVVSSAGYWLWSTWTVWRIERLAAVTKRWPTGRILDNVRVEVATRCSGSELWYTIAIVPPPANPALNRGERTDAAKAATDQVRTRLKAIRLQFVDAGGLETAVYELPMEGFIRIYSTSDERLTRLEDRNVLTCTLAQYVRSRAVKLTGIER